MNKFIFVFIFLSTCYTQAQVNYAAILGSDYTWAEKFCRSNYLTFHKCSNLFHNEIDMTMSMVFPELVRYSSVKDLLETSVLDAFYVQKGSIFVDFSIGPLQMKTSFAEVVENYIHNRQALAYLDPYFAYSEGDEFKIRRARLNRLKNIKWQIAYASAFFCCVKDYWGESIPENKEERLRFFASAYNHKFLCEFAEIIAFQSLKIYPDGFAGGKNQYAYSDVAFSFFLNSLPSIREH